MTVEPQMRQEDWQVRLPDFEGPFDLLLHLVRRGELDVSTMPCLLYTSPSPRDTG